MVKNLLANEGDVRLRFDPWVGKFPRGMAWRPTPVLLPGEFHGQRSWWDTVHRVSKNWTCLKHFSMDTLLYYDLILCNYIDNDAISKQSHILKHQELELQHNFFLRDKITYNNSCCLYFLWIILLIFFSAS